MNDDMMKEKDAHICLNNMGLDEDTAARLLGCKASKDSMPLSTRDLTCDSGFDSAFKITDLSEDQFAEAVKEQLSVAEAQAIYQKALGRKVFLSTYMAKKKSMDDPYYKGVALF